MTKDDYLDNNELLILLAIMGLGDNAYGVTIRQRLQEKAGRDFARSVIYDVLERLEKRGLVKSRLGDPTPERGGRAKTLLQAQRQCPDRRPPNPPAD